MEGESGIQDSWRFVSHSLRFAADVAIHLCKLPPKGDENGKGLTASGHVSFAKIYSTLNEVLRRGGNDSKSVLLFLSLTLITAILLSSCGLLDLNSLGSNGVSTLIGKSGMQ